MPIIDGSALNSDAVVPQCLDNQFVSDTIFQEMMRRGVDYHDRAIAIAREHDFRTEFIRSLIYSSQVVIQRAYFINSEFLYKNYLPSEPAELSAFAGLIREEAIVPFLNTERRLDDAMEFDMNQEGHRATQALLGEIGDDITCVRLRVDDASNAKAASTMATDFGARLSRLAFMEDEQRNAMATELFSDPSLLQSAGAWNAFSAAATNLAVYATTTAAGLDNRHLKRQRIYEDLFIEPSPNPDRVVLGRFRRPDAGNPFLFELKKYVDLAYNTTLPDHLKKFTFTPATLPSRMALQDAPGDRHKYTDIQALLSDPDALEYIQRAFMEHTQRAMRLPLLRDLSIADVVAIRALPEWAGFRAAQDAVLANVTQCLDTFPAFNRAFDDFQHALSDWYYRTHGRADSEEKYSSYISLSVNIGGTLLVAGSDLSNVGIAAGEFAVQALAARIPERVTGIAAKLMVGVYDRERQRLDADRTYTIELMQSAETLLREDIEELLHMINRRVDSLPKAVRGVSDQGVK